MSHGQAIRWVATSIANQTTNPEQGKHGKPVKGTLSESISSSGGWLSHQARLVPGTIDGTKC